MLYANEPLAGEDWKNILMHAIQKTLSSKLPNHSGLKTTNTDEIVRLQIPETSFKM